MMSQGLCESLLVAIGSHTDTVVIEVCNNSGNFTRVHVVEHAHVWNKNDLLFNSVVFGSVFIYLFI